MAVCLTSRLGWANFKGVDMTQDFARSYSHTTSIKLASTSKTRFYNYQQLTKYSWALSYLERKILKIQKKLP